jgi:hypothetical protein
MSSNSFSLVTKFVNKLDGVFAEQAKTSVLNTPAALIDFVGASAVKYPKIALDGLGDVDRDGDIVAGGAQLTWSTETMACHRARSFKVHKTDDEETLGAAFGYISGEFVRTKSVPEADAYRIAKMATTAIDNGEEAEATLSDSTTEAAIKAAIISMKENEAWDDENMLCFITPTVKQYLEEDSGSKYAIVQPGANAPYDDRFPRYNGMRLIEVPQSRMYTIIDQYDGSTNGGTDETGGHYVKDSSGKDINFLIVNPASVIQVVKHEIPRFFAPTRADMERYGAEGVWPDGIQWKFDYEIYHDLFVYDNKVDGLYCHHKAS